jgi:hypothetical protein
MTCTEVLRAKGHPYIRATHRTTLEVTVEDSITPRGDCIIGVSADKSALSLSEEFKNCLRRENGVLIVILEAAGLRDYLVAQTNPKLILTDPKRLIIRKSNYIEAATIGIYANKAARDLNRELITKLKNSDTQLLIHLYVLGLDEIASKDPGSRSILHY